MMNIFASRRGQVVVALSILILIGGAWYVFQKTSAEVFEIQAGDTVASWQWEGPYKDGGSLEAKTRGEIERLESLVGSGEYPDYQLHIGIAQQYELLGEGESAYVYLNKALEIDAATTGLAWHNLGVLFTRLGALNTARVAYARAVETQPDIMQYHLARLAFLTAHFQADTAGIAGAFSEAQANFGDAAPVLQLKAEWLADTGRIREAIVAWKTARRLIPASMHASVDAEIARLEAKL